MTLEDKYRLKNWNEIPLGGVIPEGGNAKDYETGTWRIFRPVLEKENCIQCLTCWVFCPEDAFLLKDGVTKSGKNRKEIESVDYYHCKGCGLCVRECPVNKKGEKKAITFVKEKI
jgi:pyruvate ferredoxin oxidoreductase delta subunit